MANPFKVGDRVRVRKEWLVRFPSLNNRLKASSGIVIDPSSINHALFIEGDVCVSGLTDQPVWSVDALELAPDPIDILIEAVSSD